MIGMTISLLMLGGLAALFAGNSEARREIDRASQQIENGRYAIQLLRDDIHLAGYFGDYLPRSSQRVDACMPRAGVVLSAGSLGWIDAPPTSPLPIQGYASGDLPAAESCFSNLKPNTDILIVRSADTASATVAAAADPSNSTDYYLQSSACADRSVDPATKPFVVGAGGASALSRFVLNRKDCVTLSPVRKLVVHAYYIGRCSVCTGSGDGIPALRMIELTGATTTNTSLVEGIESMRVEYMLDTDGDGQPDALRRCKIGTDPCAVADWLNVVGVQVHLLARSLSTTAAHRDGKIYDMGLAGPLGPFGDGYRRHRYSTTAIAHNRAGPRER